MTPNLTALDTMSMTDLWAVYGEMKRRINEDIDGDDEAAENMRAAISKEIQLRFEAFTGLLPADNAWEMYDER